MTTQQGSNNDQPMEQRGILLLLGLCVLLMAVGAGAKSFAGGPAVEPLVLGDVSKAAIVEIRNAAGNAVLSGEFRSRVDVVGNTEKDAPLIDRQGRAVIGEVELEIPAPARTDRRTELEVDILGLEPRQRFTVAIDDRVVGAFVTDDRGGIDMELQEGELPPSFADIVQQADAPRAPVPCESVPPASAQPASRR